MSKRNKKIVLSPEELEVYAEANAAKNGTTPEEEKKKIQSEILGKGSWALEAGESDKVLQEATGKENPTKDDVQKSIQGIIDNPYPSIGDAKGNPGDNINNPNSLVGEDADYPQRDEKTP